DWYRYFPWEDRRKQKPAIIADAIAPALRAFARSSANEDACRDRTRLCFGLDGLPWDEEKVLERYELLYEAGLVLEAARDGRAKMPDADLTNALGASMMFDHRRILATAISR